MVLLTILLPIFGSFASGLLGRYIGYNVAKYLATGCVMIACLLSYIIYIDVMFNNNIYYVNVGKWIYVEYLEIDWAFLIDELAATMLIPVLTISSLVHLYATGYMSHDPHQQRFFSVLSMFTGFMVVLVTADNYLVMFVGWEYIGVASYLLISFWHTRLAAMKSALSALLMNKFGDLFITIGLFVLIWTFGTVNYTSIFALSVYINTDILNIIMICMLLGACAKSAQLGLHNWLLNSMEGPTPVSALLHAACLVCAGIYLLIRSSYILEYSPMVLLIILWVGGLTTLVAGLIAIVSNDIKKIVALSTMSQLGLMVVAIGISAYNISLFHLFCHAMFKALLFMSAGSIIHSVLSESQDIRTHGGLLHYIPVTYVCILIASLSLMAFPGLTGFYSKDIIIESMYGVYSVSGFIMYWLSLTSATLTTLYSIRLLYLVFFNTPNSSKYTYYNVHESGLAMLTPMIILAFASIAIGYLTRDIYLGMGSPFSSILIHPDNLSIIDTEFGITTFYKMLPLVMTVVGTVSVLFLYEYKYTWLYIFNNDLLRSLYVYGNSKFMLDQILNNVILRSSLYLGYLLNHFVDKGLLQIYGPMGLYNALNKVSYKVISLSTNSGIIHYNIYLLSALVGIVLYTFTNTSIAILFILLLLI